MAEASSVDVPEYTHSCTKAGKPAKLSAGNVVNEFPDRSLAKYAPHPQKMDARFCKGVDGIRARYI